MRGHIVRGLSTARSSAEVPELTKSHLELEAGFPR